MTQIVTDPKAPKESTDYIYAERMEPFEERMNFFLNKKIEVNKDKVADKDKGEIDGLESLLERFSSYQSTKVAGMEENVAVDGTEGIGLSTYKGLIDLLVQLAKDAATWIIDFATNRVRRIDNRLFRVNLERKRSGLTSREVPYPAGIRRLITPSKVSADPGWVSVALSDVHTWYKGTIKAYRYLVGEIKDHGENFDLLRGMNNTIDAAASLMGMQRVQGGYQSIVLPGNRHFVLDNVTDTVSDQIGLYFSDSTIDTRLKAKKFTPTSFMVDKTLKQIKDMVKEIQSNQSTVSQLIRQFEKQAKAFERDNGARITPAQRRYFNWLIRFNRRLMNLSIQYTINSMDAGLDFCQAGINK